MSQKIKKEIKRSLPWFVILCLVISSTVIGLVFNFGISLNLNNQNSNISLDTSVPAVQADNATTTVTVLNAPPDFTIAPAEYKAGVVEFSTSTSPVNEGDGIQFIATADDPESDEYFLIICDQPGVTPHNNTVPTCDNTMFCRSASTTSGNQASCIYEVQDPIPTAETDQWYAYVCDGHATEADCTADSDPYIQGASPNNYASSSPFYINHAPSWNIFATTINNQPPGGTFEFVATSTDTDVLGGADAVVLYVCDNGGYATSTGCLATEYCHATSTAVGGVAGVYCQWTDTAPTPDTDYTVWGYIRDSHYMPPDSGNGTTTTYTIINVAPTISNVILNGGASIEPNLKNATTEELASTTAQINDQNGCGGGELVSATSTIYWSEVANDWECAANDNNCYKITSASCVISNCVGAQADVMCTTTIAFHAIPTENAQGNPNGSTWWEGAVRAFDDDGATGVASSTPDTVNMLITEGLEVTEDEIPYRAIKGGQDSDDYNATTTIVNYGNSPIDSDIGGDNMFRNGVGPELIAYDEQCFATSTFTYGVGFCVTLAASTTPPTIDVDIPRPTSQTNVEDELYWGINIPGGTLSGDYEGENLFQVGVDVSGWP